MKQRLLALFTVLSLGALLAVPMAASAKLEQGSGGNAHINSGQTVDDDLYIAGRDVVVEGTVNGDVYAAGSTVTIKGTVNGDVLAAGQDVFISGTVKGSVRAAGNNVRLNGAKISGSVSDFSQTFTVENDSTISGGLNFGAATANIRGSVSRSLVAGGNDITLSNSIGKDVDIWGGNITLESGAVINGHLNYYGSGKLNKQSGAQVKGDTHHYASQPKQHHNDARTKALGVIWGLISLYLVGAVLLWLLPLTTVGISREILRRPGAALGWGLLALIVTIPLVVILAITVVGIPLAVLLAIAFGVAIYISQFFVALTVGELLARRIGWTPNVYADALIGLIILVLLELIPIVGAIIRFLTIVFGLGGIVIYKRRQMSMTARTERAARS